MIYLTGSHNELTAADGRLGLLVQPRSGYLEAIDRYQAWAADNGCFTTKQFDEQRWRRWLRDLAPRAGSCLFATALDVVADCDATQRRADRQLQFIRSLGFKAALVAQDELERSDFACNCAAGRRAGKRWARLSGYRQRAPQLSSRLFCAGCGDEWGWFPDAPADYDGCWYCMRCAPPAPTCTCDWWGSFDVLFIGGTTEWKLSAGAAELVQMAKDRGKWVHMGRVNSRRRLLYAQSIGCDSADGTYIAFGPSKNMPKLASWLDELEVA